MEGLLLLWRDIRIPHKVCNLDFQIFSTRSDNGDFFHSDDDELMVNLIFLDIMMKTAGETKIIGAFFGLICVHLPRNSHRSL